MGYFPLNRLLTRMFIFRDFLSIVVISATLHYYAHYQTHELIVYVYYYRYTYAHDWQTFRKERLFLIFKHILCMCISSV